MNLKAPLITFCFLLYFTGGFAQRRNVYFMKNSGEKVKLLDSADFIRVVSEPDSGSKLYNAKDYYKSKKIKFVGKSSEIDPVKIQGQAVSYYESGTKKQYANFKDDKFEGDVYTYFPNGKLYTYQIYKQKKTDVGAGFDIDCTTLLSNDSTGKELVVNGNGYFKGYDGDFKNVINEGYLKNGLSDGQWKGASGSGKDYMTFNEEYKDGNLLTGEAVDKQGKIYNYTTRVIEPEFKGGIQRFYEFIGENTVYPEEARSRNITGKVFISFVVEKDGSLTDLKVKENPNDLLSQEALRVLKQSPKWAPGIVLGRISRVQYTIPVNFTLSNR